MARHYARGGANRTTDGQGAAPAPKLSTAKSAFQHAEKGAALYVRTTTQATASGRGSLASKGPTPTYPRDQRTARRRGCPHPARRKSVSRERAQVLDTSRSARHSGTSPAKRCDLQGKRPGAYPRNTAGPNPVGNQPLPLPRFISTRRRRPDASSCCNPLASSS